MSASRPPDGHYLLSCRVCGRRQPDDGLLLDCPAQHEPSLLHTEYRATALVPRATERGLFRYRNWLPISRTLPDAGATVTYRSTTGVARHLGMDDLWIAFNGYWPERDARLTTATFKELEAFTVLGRCPTSSAPLVIASAGNTAAAFAELCSKHEIGCVLVVPASGLAKLRFAEPPHPCVRLIALDRATYSDAIAFGDSIAREHGLPLEGGTRNVGRRDGLATVLYNAVEAMSDLPEFYFQGIGSGAGAIAVHEAAQRLARAGRAGPPPRLMLCQNAEFSPVRAAWHAGPTPPEDRALIDAVYADELTNRRPPYAVRGGLRDCLTESRGEVLVADARSARAAAAVFRDLEGIDIEPAAAVALACLRDSVLAGTTPRSAKVLLNVTGGGRARREHEHDLATAVPDLRVDHAEVGSASVTRAVEKLINSLARV
ncbi:cysteate synthase [Actinosynnema sp. NPDC047251]|uniref:L-threonine synthase n=1 Tax=Saccharothrix espanaensis (strain ATCC 51144 / DSM 44229 / JCM 9112 / NBRC 15066 / NRRL 15764) TaxID=1179773 RepID=K0JYY0_SACES|nr:cysteate synthase [Saccharothrix espanaensis]CCH33145.1 L-threonine synthase [Saccharothrix espanaensis DSM 44229]